MTISCRSVDLVADYVSDNYTYDGLMTDLQLFLKNSSLTQLNTVNCRRENKCRI